MNNETLFGGRDVKVKLLDGTEADIKVRQIPLGEYQTAIKLTEAGDEIGFVALCVSQSSSSSSSPSIQNIQPESYELLHAAALEVNDKGFFSWKARRDSREQEKESQRLAAQAGAEATKEIVLRSAMAGMESRSPVGSLPPRPVPR